MLAGEALRDSQPAALEALAITIRTFALANRGRHRADGFDLCDQTHCQVVRAADAATERAAQATAGRAAAARRRAGVGLLLGVVRRAHGAAVRRLAGRRGSAVFCRRKTTMRVRARRRGRRSCTRRDLLRALRASGFAAIAARRADCVAQRVGPRRAAEARRLASRIRSPARTCASRSGARSAGSTSRARRSTCARTTASYRFSGHGSGHGVGMCVIGSARLAERGVSAEEILARYFPGLEISRRSAVLTGVRPGSDPVVTPQPPQTAVSAPRNQGQTRV